MVEGRRWEQLSYKQFDSLDNMIPSLSTRRDTDMMNLVRGSDHTYPHMMMMTEMRREEETMTSRQPKMIQTPGKKKINFCSSLQAHASLTLQLPHVLLCLSVLLITPRHCLCLVLVHWSHLLHCDQLLQWGQLSPAMSRLRVSRSALSLMM